MAAPVYDPNNVFARILRGELPCRKIHETPHSLAFHTISPQRAVHALVITKGAYTDMADFTARGTAEEMADFMKAVGDTARVLGVDESGYRTISNCRAHAKQEVSHLHMHILGGEMIGGLIGERE